MSHIEKTEAELEPIKKMKERLIAIVESEINKGCVDTDTKELGEAIDMIKDLAEADKACWSALYYKSVVKAMEKSEEYEELRRKMDTMFIASPQGGMGYNPNRSSTTGRYMSGYGTGRIGMTLEDEMQMPYIDDYLDGRMGYSPSGTGNRSQSGSRMGMTTFGQGQNGSSGGQGSGSSSYTPFDSWREARRHYTETKDSVAKKDMDMYASEHLAQTIATMREMWKEADPEMRTRMKQDLQNLVNELKT